MASHRRNNDLYIFKMYDDPNEIDDDDDESDNGAIHEEMPIELLENILIRNPQEYFECQLKQKKWQCGDAILTNDDAEDPEFIHLPTAASCGRAFNGDTVVVKLKEPKPFDEVGSKCIGKGSVVGVLKRAYANIYEESFTCRVDENNCSVMIPISDNSIKFYVISPYFRFRPRKVFKYHRKPVKKGEKDVELTKPQEIELEKEFSSNSKPSQLFSVRYMNWSKYSRLPRGYVESSFDALSLKRYFLQFDIGGKHSEKNERKAVKLLEETDVTLKRQPARKDLTGLYVFTIDDTKASCLDDALSIESCKEHSECWKVGVHIADVGSRLPEKSKLNAEAKKRLLSVQGLSSDTEKDFDKTDGKLFPPSFLASCSLNSDNKTKFAVSTFFHSKHPPLCIYTGESKTYNFNKHPPILSTVKPKRKLSYVEAQQLICRRKDDMFHQGNDGNLAQQLYHLWQVMWQFRLQRLNKAAYYIDKLNFTASEMSPDQCLARLLVDEAMITVNAYTAQYLKYRKITFFVRCQPAPPLEDMKLVDMLELSPYQESFSNFYKKQKMEEQLVDEIPETTCETAWESYSGGDEDLRLKEKWLRTTGTEGSVNARMKLLGFGIFIKSVCPSKADKMIVSKDVWQEIESFLTKGDTEIAVFLACCDLMHPEIGASLSAFNSVQHKHQIKISNFRSLPHFLLRLDAYTRCSSPLRRYIDLDTQRRLVKCLCGEDQPNPPDTDLCTKQIEKEEDFESFEQCLAIHNTYARNLQKDCVEGFVLEFSEFEIVVFFPNYNVVSKLSVPLNELGPTKRVENTKLEWTLRYYDIAVQKRVDQTERSKPKKSGLSSHFEARSVVCTLPWKTFIGGLKEDADIENCQNNLNLQRVCDSLSLDEVTEGQHVIAGAFRTSNGIYHGRHIEFHVLSKKKAMEKNKKSTLGSSMHFQFGLSLEKSMQVVVPQLLFLNRKEEKGSVGLEICMLHRRHVTIFEVDCDEITLKKEDFSSCDKRYLMYLYYEKWIPLVRMDGTYSSVQSCDSVTLQLERVQLNGVKGQFTLGKMFCENCFLQIRKGDFLCIRKRNDRGKFSVSVVHGVVTEAIITESAPSNVYRFKVFTCLDYEPFALRSDDIVSCEVIPLNISHRRMVQALSSLPNASPLVQTICVGKKDDLSNLPLNLKAQSGIGHIFPSYPPSKLGNFPHPLNDKQYGQVKKALHNQFTLIQGPPGTGKSYMGAHLAYYFTELSKRIGNKGKVLYCGPSNKSVDVVAEYLKYIPGFKFMRVYGGVIEEMDFRIPIKPLLPNRSKTGKVPSSLRDHTLHLVIRQPGSNRHARSIRMFDEKCIYNSKTVTLKDYKDHLKLVNEAKMEILSKVDVIVCTCSVAGGQLLSEFEFLQCIVDESGMCSEPETLIPIMTATAKTPNPQIVLIGDHKQLEPVITYHPAAKGGLKKSMFERLNFLAESLTKQYRMDPKIREFPSTYFYGDKLVDDESVVKRANVFNDYNSPAIFVNVDGFEEEDESKSKYNTYQVKVAMIFLEKLLKKGVATSKIMILSPYLAQCGKLKKAIEKSKRLSRYKSRTKLDSIHVGSVVTSQGSEADYVILSTVRSSHSTESLLTVDPSWLYKRIGFVTDDHQINVAITRARLGLIVIGNAKLLQYYRTWRELISNYKEKGALLGEQELDDVTSSDESYDDS